MLGAAAHAGVHPGLPGVARPAPVGAIGAPGFPPGTGGWGLGSPAQQHWFDASSAPVGHLLLQSLNVQTGDMLEAVSSYAQLQIDGTIMLVVKKGWPMDPASYGRYVDGGFARCSNPRYAGTLEALYNDGNLSINNIRLVHVCTAPVHHSPTAIMDRQIVRSVRIRDVSKIAESWTKDVTVVKKRTGIKPIAIPSGVEDERATTKQNKKKKAKTDELPGDEEYGNKVKSLKRKLVEPRAVDLRLTPADQLAFAVAAKKQRFEDKKRRRQT